MTGATTAPVAVNDLVAYAFAAVLERTTAFYARLGFEVESTFPAHGPTTWMSLRSGAAQLFFEIASHPIDDTAQGVLFYLYCDDIAALRQRLLAAGVEVSSIAYPPHMPAGQMRFADPDGYALFVGQLSPAAE